MSNARGLETSAQWIWASSGAMGGEASPGQL